MIQLACKDNYTQLVLIVCKEAERKEGKCSADASNARYFSMDSSVQGHCLGI